MPEPGSFSENVDFYTLSIQIFLNLFLGGFPALATPPFAVLVPASLYLTSAEILSKVSLKHIQLEGSPCFLSASKLYLT